MATNLFVPDWARDVKISTILEIMVMFGITYETYAKSRKWFLSEYQERKNNDKIIMHEDLCSLW